MAGFFMYLASPMTAASFEETPSPAWVHVVFDQLAELSLLEGAESVYSPNKVYSRLDSALLLAAAFGNLGNRDDLLRLGLELETLRNIRKLAAEFVEDMVVLFKSEVQTIGERILVVESRIRELEALGKGKVKVEASAIQVRPDLLQIETLFREASYQCRQGNLWEAVSTYQKIISIDPMHLDAHVSLGIVYLYLAEHDKAYYAFRKALSIDDSHMESLLACGDIKMVQEKWSEAEAYYRRALDIDPGNKEARLNLGTLYVNYGELNKAFMEYKRLLEVRPYDEDALLSLGLVYQWKKEYDKAEITFKKVLSVEPGSKRAFLFLGRLFRETGRYDDSEKVLRQYLMKYDAGSTDTLIELARTLVAADVPEEAIVTYARLLTIDPKNFEVMKSLAMIHLRRGDLASVSAVCSRIIEIDPANKFAHLLLARIKRADGDLGASSVHCARVLEKNSGDSDALAVYGTVLLDLGKEREALDKYRQALEHDPDQVEANLGIGLINLDREHYRKAERYLGRALTADPGNVQTAKALSRLYRELDMLASAVHYAKIARDNTPGGRTSSDDLKVLDRLDNFLLTTHFYMLDRGGQLIYEPGDEFKLYLVESGVEALVNDLLKVGASFGIGEIREPNRSTHPKTLKQEHLKLFLRYRTSFHWVNEAHIASSRFSGASDSTGYGFRSIYRRNPVVAELSFRDFRMQENIAVMLDDYRMEETAIRVGYQLLPELSFSVRPSWARIHPDGNEKREVITDVDYQLPGPFGLSIGYRSNFFSFERENVQGVKVPYFVVNRYLGHTFKTSWNGRLPRGIQAKLGYDYTRYTYRITDKNLNQAIPAGNYKGVGGKLYLKLEMPLATYSRGSLWFARSSTDHKNPPVDLKAAREILLSLSLRF